MAGHGQRSAVVRQSVNQYPRKVYDDPVHKDYRPELQMDSYGVYVGDIHGRTVHRLDTEDPNLLPQSKRDIICDHLREVRAQEARSQTLQEAIPSAAEHILEVYLAFIDWDAVMLDGGGCSDDELLAVTVFFQPMANGQLERGIDGWPIHGSYCFVGATLHQYFPNRFFSTTKNGKRIALHQERAKKLVLDGLSKQVSAYIERHVPRTWSLKEIRDTLERQFGDDSHRVPHRKA